MQRVHVEIISNQNTYFILHRHLVHICNQKPSLALLPPLKHAPPPGGSDSIIKPAVWKQVSIRAHQMIKEGCNGFRFPLLHLVLETNYSHTFTSWALKATNTPAFSQILSLLFLFLQRFSKYIDRHSCLAPQNQQGYFFLVHDDSLQPLLALVLHPGEERRVTFLGRASCFIKFVVY